MLKRSALPILATLTLLLAWLCAPSPAAADPASHVAGIVTDRDTAAPIAGVEVSLVQASPFAVVDTAVTDGSGAYDIVGPDSGSYLLRFRDPAKQHTLEYLGGTTVSVGATPITVTDAATTTVDYTLAPAAVLTGHVTDSVGNPIADANAVVLVASTGAILITLKTDANGDWQSGAVLIRGYKIRYYKAGHPVEWNDNRTSLATADVVTPTAYTVETFPAAALT